MSTPRLTTIRQGLVTALALVNGTGDYTLDLSGQDQVLQGPMSAPPRPGKACVMLDATAATSTKGYALGQWTRTVTWRLWCWAPFSGNSAALRHTAREQLAHEVVIAVQYAVRHASGSLYGVVLDLDLVDMGDIAGSDEAAGWVSCSLTFTFDFTRGKLEGL